jgi:predicted methyltransferase
MKYHFLITMAALLLVACQPDAPSDPATETQGQDKVTTVAADTPAGSEDPAKEPEPASQSRDGLAALYAKAINHPERPQTDSDRDSQRQPAEILPLMAVEPGMSVLDLFAGGGYYTELLSRIVGAKGEVWSQNPPQFYERFGSADIDDRLAGYRLPNVVRHDLPLDDLALPANRFDGAVAAMVLHDFFWLSENVPAVLLNIHAAMKPGAWFLVTDHAAPKGTGAEFAVDYSGKHRIEESYVVSIMADAGFELVGSSDVLRQPGDDRSKAFFEPEMRGKFTDRFVLLFRRVE